MAMRELSAGASKGLWVGAVAGAVAGLVLGGLCGFFNEVITTGVDNEDLFVGFAEYSMRGMAFFSLLVCSFVGMIGGTLGGSLGASTKNKLISTVAGVILGIVLSGTLIWASSASLDGVFWKQENLVWTLASAIACAIAGLVCTASSTGADRTFGGGRLPERRR